MARIGKKIMVGPKTQQRPVVQEWLVYFEDPESSIVVEYDLRCNRGQFFNALRAVLQADGQDPDNFDIASENWARELKVEYR